MTQNIQNISMSSQTLPQTPREKVEKEAAPEVQDKVTLSDEKSIAAKILSVPKAAVKAVVGSAFAVASAAIHTPTGTAEGIAEGLSMDYEHVDAGWFHGVTLGEFAIGGAASGFCMGGPIGMGIGAGVGFVAGLLTLAVERKAGFPDRFVEKVEKAVDETIKNNHSDSKIRLLTQNITEGAITGTGVGFKESLKEGYQAGAGVVDGVCDVMTGFAQGIHDALWKNRK